MQPHQQLSTERRVRATELATEQVIALPTRAALSLVNANVAAPINAALALNALSDHSVAVANAQQMAPINQGI
jgi:hypothetical protein